MLSEDDFIAYGAQGFTLSPLWRTVPLPEVVDPLALYRGLADEGQDFLFETGEFREGGLASTYSVIGLPCRERFELDEGRLRHIRDDMPVREIATDDPLAELARIHQRFQVPRLKELPPFSGGLFGYFGFETTRLIEPRLRREPRKPSGLPVPDALLWLTTDLVVLDHDGGRAFCIVHEAPTSASAYRRGRERLDRLVDAVESLLDTPAAPRPPRLAVDADTAPVDFAFPRSDFEAAVRRIKDYIADGDVMQVVLSQRMERPFDADAATLYRALSDLASTPYRYILNLGDSQVVGASPEMLFRLRDGAARSRPMAGTRHRGADAEQDRALRDELLADPKEIAEHMMLVDLARNDLGRLAEAGRVQVDQLRHVEFFSHVMHIVSSVTGHLPDTVSPLDVVKSTFPAGTLSGASKVRALEVIAELEPHSRGPYGGAIGYLDWHANADLAITIRTGVIHGGKLYIQAGAGIVQDSEPRREWQEGQDKSRTMLLAAGLADVMAREEQPEEALCIS
jgi:anthranilate synthase component 1